MKRFTALFVALVLIVGTVGCPASAPQYALTISSTEGGSVTVPGEGAFKYGAGTVVDLVAESDEGHRFVGWTGDVSTVGDVLAASTTITMNSHCLVTANFVQEIVPEPPPDLEPPDTRVVKVAVAAPMESPHGQHMMQGAQIAVSEIGEFTAGGNTYEFQLVQVNTADLTGDTAATRLAVEAAVGAADFFIGGLRTDHTHVMLEVVCRDNGKVFLGLGWGNASLTRMVQDDYDNYKYFFRVLPLNDYFLLNSAFKIFQSVVMTLVQDPDLPFENMADVNVYILAENAEWAHQAVVAAEAQLLPALGVNHVGTARSSDTAGVDALLPVIADMAAKNTHVVMTILAGTVGFSWAAARHQSGLPVISAGINSMAQMTDFGQLGAPAIGEITLDATARDIQLSPITRAFLNAWSARYAGDYPLHTGVSAYDSIYLLKAAIQATNGDLDSGAIAAAIPGLELDSVSGKIVFYPPAAIDLGSQQSGLRALSAAQAYDLYGDHLLTFYGHGSFAEMEANWGAHSTDWTSPPHLPQDLAYGPAAGNTAIASQWQGTAAAPVKVAVWPRQHAPEGTPVGSLKAMGLFDKWGNWNFQYPGTGDIVIPPLFYEKWGD